MNERVKFALTWTLILGFINIVLGGFHLALLPLLFVFLYFGYNFHSLLTIRAHVDKKKIKQLNKEYGRKHPIEAVLFPLSALIGLGSLFVYVFTKDALYLFVFLTFLIIELSLLKKKAKAQHA